MSGCSYDATCPECGSTEMSVSSDWKPYDCVSGECLECGFSFSTMPSQMSLEEVNERRADYEKPPLTALKEKSQCVN